MRPTTLLSVCVLWTVAFASVEPATAGAWLRDVGGLYAKTSLLGTATDERFDCEGDRTAAEPFGGRYRERLWFTYLEWGVHERLTLVGSFGVKDARIVDAEVPDYGTRSTGDLRLGVRWGWLRGAWPVSLEVIGSLPTYPRTDPRVGVGAREQFLPAGSGTFESEWRILVGRSLHPLPLYANLDLGYRTRGGAFGDQWLFAVEAGGTAGRLFLKNEVRALLPTGDPCASSSAGAVTLHERSWRWNPELAVALSERWWVGLGTSLPLDGRNALSGIQWTLSLSFERRGSGS